MRLVLCCNAMRILAALRFFHFRCRFLLFMYSAMQRFYFGLCLSVWLFLFLSLFFFCFFVVHFFARHHIIIQGRVDIKVLKVIVGRPLPRACSALYEQRGNFLFQLFMHPPKISLHPFQWRPAKGTSHLSLAAPLANALWANGVTGIKNKCTCISWSLVVGRAKNRLSKWCR